jgi:hypothetical protein
LFATVFETLAKISIWAGGSKYGFLAFAAPGILAFFGCLVITRGI